jgi:hypothetical protein
MQVAATIMKSNADAEKFAVQTLRARARRRLPMSAPGVGGNLDISP